MNEIAWEKHINFLTFSTSHQVEIARRTGGKINVFGAKKKSFLLLPSARSASLGSDSVCRSFERKKRKTSIHNREESALFVIRIFPDTFSDAPSQRINKRRRKKNEEQNKCL